MKYTHIIWDWNGTLLDDRWLCVEIINTMLEPRNLPLMDENRYRSVFGFPIFDYYVRLGFDFDKDPFEKIAADFIQKYRQREAECSLQTGVIDVLRRCQQIKISQTVLSAMQQEMLESMIQRYNLHNYFQSLVGLDDHYADGKIENGKAHIKDLNLKPAEVLLVGDTDHDFEVASEMEVNVLLVANGHHSKERLAKTGAKVVNSIEQVPAILTNS